MPHDRLEGILLGELQRLETEGRRKGAETVIAGVMPGKDGRGPRYLIAGAGDKPFLRMNANNYLGLSLRAEIVAGEDEGVRRFGTGPGAVRFISGTWAPHVALEHALAAFHGREDAMILSSAYAAIMGLLPPLTTPDTAVISDALNHNSIINSVRLARPRERAIYAHLDLDELEARLDEARKTCRRAIIVTDGIFSMRGDHAPLAEITAIARRYDPEFPENVLVVMDDSHGVGAFGATGRGTEEQTGARADIIIGTLGKAFGVNGGYIAASSAVISYLRETSPFYIYSNPISPGEAAAAARAVSFVDSPAGQDLLRHLRAMTVRFRDGLARLGLETIGGDHPVVPLDGARQRPHRRAGRHLRRSGVLATGLNFPVVPKGDEEIRFQICADHTPQDIDEALGMQPPARAKGGCRLNFSEENRPAKPGGSLRACCRPSRAPRPPSRADRPRPEDPDQGRLCGEPRQEHRRAADGRRADRRKRDRRGRRQSSGGRRRDDRRARQAGAAGLHRHPSPHLVDDPARDDPGWRFPDLHEGDRRIDGTALPARGCLCRQSAGRGGRAQ